MYTRKIGFILEHLCTHKGVLSPVRALTGTQDIFFHHSPSPAEQQG